jgi:hypothetical protein
MGKSIITCISQLFGAKQVFVIIQTDELFLDILILLKFTSYYTTKAEAKLIEKFLKHKFRCCRFRKE